MRIHEFSKEVGKTSKEIIVKLAGLGISVKSHMSSIDDEAENKLMTEAGKITFYPFEMKNRDDWTDEMRLKEIDILTKVLGKEKEAYLIVKEINKKIEG